MTYINSNFPQIAGYVRKEFLYDNEAHHGELEPAYLFAVSSIPDHCLMLHVMLENGAMFSRLPFHSFVWKETKEETPLSSLQLWNSFSYDFAVYTFDFLTGMQCETLLKHDSNWHSGTYYTTVDWINRDNEASCNFAEDPSNHKLGHIILLDSGHIACQPNNRIRWREPALITKPFETKPDYKVQSRYYGCENAADSTTTSAGNTDAYFYEIFETKCSC